MPFKCTPLQPRFWQYVDRSVGPDSCWIWTGAIFKMSGYGRFSLYVNGVYRSMGSHRVCYEFTYGAIGDTDVKVCHKCDVKLCVNPNHLFLGSQAENVADRDRKGRQCKGVRSHSARLTEQQVHEI